MNSDNKRFFSCDQHVTPGDLASGRYYFRVLGENTHHPVLLGSNCELDEQGMIKVNNNDVEIWPMLYEVEALKFEDVHEYELRAGHPAVTIKMQDNLVVQINQKPNGVRVGIERDGTEAAHAEVTFNENDRWLAEFTSFEELSPERMRIILILARLGASDNRNLEAVSRGLGITWSDMIRESDTIYLSTTADYELVRPHLPDTDWEAGIDGQ